MSTTSELFLVLGILFFLMKSISSTASCGGDPNAISGCGFQCVQRCSTYGQPPRPCPLICQVNACTCKEGYIVDDVTGKCIRPDQCTIKPCGQNQQYTSCVEGGCFGAKYCSEIKNGTEPPVKCVKPKYCTAGCICQDGYVKNDNGICVLKEECPLNDKCSGKAYEYLNTCAPNCAVETCSQIGQDIPCPPQATVCRERCLCAQGYYRDAKGNCIQKNQCPQPCPLNESWDTCFNGGCYGPRNCSQIGGPTICVDLTEGGCRGGCLCRDDWLRDDKGKCVPPSKCKIPTTTTTAPPPSCPAGQKLGCGDNCNSKCYNYISGKPSPCPRIACIPSISSCQCDPKQGTYYSESKGKCVPAKDCKQYP